MNTDQAEALSIITVQSASLKREVRIDIYKSESTGLPNVCSLLLVNDGQDLLTMQFEKILYSLQLTNKLRPLIVAAIHCGIERKNEYGMAIGPDYQGWGDKAARYENFVIDELLPLLRSRFGKHTFSEIAFAGFSLGGLSAFDIAWNHPEIFKTVGVFSGSLWWRSKDKNHKAYDPWQHRMLHKQVRESGYRQGMKFFFECGENDESEDRNNNRVIDSIDDTIDLMRILVRKGYREGQDIYYLQLPDGKHDVPTWARAIPVFLEWAFMPAGRK
jgi:enterochelin esterase-like enzyme